MSQEYVLAAGGDPQDWPDLSGYLKRKVKWIGVDKGALYLLNRGIVPDMAVGDFDSLSKAELSRVRNQVSKIYSSVAEKDDTDTQLALLAIFQETPAALVSIIGATGGRIDHFLSNLWLPLEERFAERVSQISIKDRQNSITYYLSGQHKIKKIAEMKYLGFICLTAVKNLSLYHTKYLLINENISGPFSYGSNEFLDETAEFSFDSGVVAVIQSRD